MKPRTAAETTEKLVRKAKSLGKHKTKRETIDAALQEYVQKRMQRKIIELFGKVDYFDDYDLMAERKKARG